MQVAIVLYPAFTALDVMGPYEVLGRLPDTEVVFVAERPGHLTNDLGSLSVKVDASFSDVAAPDVVLVGGGPGQAQQMDDGPLHQWLRIADETDHVDDLCVHRFADPRRSRAAHRTPCDQSLDGGRSPRHLRRHPGEGACRHRRPLRDRGRSVGRIDLALTLGGLIAGDEAAQVVQLIIEYAPEPPYRAGSIDTAPQSVIDSIRMADAPPRCGSGGPPPGRR